MKQYITYCEEETKNLAKQLASKLHGVIALSGELGAGKTTFVQGFANGLGIKEKIISPTFILIRQHKIPDSKNMLYHVDLYRLENLDNLKHLGLEECWADPKNIVLIEWAQKAKELLPKNTVWIKFENTYGNKRKISISNSALMI